MNYSYLQYVDYELTQYAKTNNIEICYIDTKIPMYISLENGHYIGIKGNYFGELIWIKAHELGHFATKTIAPKGKSSKYMIAFNEIMANLWALNKLKLLNYAESNHSKRQIKSLVKEIGLPSIVSDWIILFKKYDFSISIQFINRVRRVIERYKKLQQNLE